MQYRKEKTARINELDGVIDNARRSYNELQLELAKKSGEIPLLQQRIAEYQSAVQSLQSDLDRTNSRSQSLNDTMNRLEKSVASQNFDLAREREESKRLTAERENLRAERDMAKTSALRLESDVENMRKELESRDKLIHTFRSIEETFERKETDNRKALIQEKDSYRRECMELRKELEEGKRSNRETIAANRIALDEYKLKLEASEKRYHTEREQSIKLQCSVDHLNQQLTALQTSSKSVQDQLDTLLHRRAASSGAAEKVDLTGAGFSALGKERQLELDLAKEREELLAVQEQLTASQAAAAESKKLAHELDTQLKALVADHEAYTRQVETKLSELRAERDRALVDCDRITASAKQTEAESEQLRESMEQKVAAIQQTVRQSEIDKSKLSDEITGLQRTIARLNTDLNAQTALAEAERTRYNQELISHANDTQRAAATQQELTAVSARVNGLELELASAQAIDAQNRESFATQRESLTTQITGLEAKVKELTHQHSLVLEHLEQVTTKAKKIQEQNLYGGGSGVMLSGLTAFTAQSVLPSAAGGASASTATASDDKDVQIASAHEILTFVRREKELATLDLERITQQMMSYRQQAELRAKTIDELKITLAAEQQKSKSVSVSV